MSTLLIRLCSKWGRQNFLKNLSRGNGVVRRTSKEKPTSARFLGWRRCALVEIQNDYNRQQVGGIPGTPVPACDADHRRPM